MAARVAAEGLPPLAHDEGADLGRTSTTRRSTTRRSSTTRRRRRRRTRRRASTRSIPKLLETYEKLGIPLRERAKLAGVAVDAVFDSVSVATTFKGEAREGRASSSARSPRRSAKHPELVRKYLGSVVPYTRQLLRDAQLGGLHATARSATSRRACAARWSCRPTSASTRRTPGQFERTLIVADEGAYVSYLEGCTAPMRDENQLHAAVVELVALDDARDQVLDGAELVPRRQGRQAAASTTS